MTSALSTLAAVLVFATRPHQHAGHSTLMHFFFHLGLVGLFLLSIVDSSFVPLPIPGMTDIMVILYAASHENVIALVAVATVGSALGGLFSHMVGQAGGMAFLQKHVSPAILTRVTAWMEAHAILAVALPAILPPPAPLSPFVLAAGAAHMSRKKFMIAFTVSRLLRHIVAAWLGIHYGKAVLRIWNMFSARWGTTVLIGLWTFILLFTALAIWRLIKTSRELHLNPTTRNQTSTSPQASPAETML